MRHLTRFLLLGQLLPREDDTMLTWGRHLAAAAVLDGLAAIGFGWWLVPALAGDDDPIASALGVLIGALGVVIGVLGTYLLVHLAHRHDLDDEKPPEWLPHL